MRQAAQLEPTSTSVARRVAALAWPALSAELDASGSVVVPQLLTPEECAALVALYDEPAHFRSRVVMARHGYGRGEYQYFADPLPALVRALREAAYAPLAGLANAWHERMRLTRRFPDELSALHAECAREGQLRPTPLLLKYGPGDYNCLHQDVYGELLFPLQIAVLLSAPGEAFSGGEFVLTEQRPRMQSRVEVVPLRQGDAVIFAVRQRPVSGARGSYRVQMRHGVSRVRSGARYTLGVIFHQAR
jgi:uncharacterized protein